MTEQMPEGGVIRSLVRRIKFEDFVTGVITALVGAALLGAYAILWNAISDAHEHAKLRELLRGEIRFRLQQARHEDEEKSGMVKSRLNGDDARFCRQKQFAGVLLVNLLDMLQETGDVRVTDDLVTLAADPKAATDQSSQLLKQLDAAVPPTKTKSEEGVTEMILDLVRDLSWPAVALVLGILAILRFSPLRTAPQVESNSANGRANTKQSK